MSNIQLDEQVEAVYKRVNHHYKIILDADADLERDDTCKGVITILDDLRTILNTINALSVEDRAKHYNIAYNAITYIMDVTSLMRRTNYSYEAIKALLDCIGCMESNIVLQDVKYMDRKVKLYLQICHIYQEGQYFQAAISLLEDAIQKIKELRMLHEMDPPIPTHVNNIITNNTNILKIMWIKYSIQSGIISAGEWKKKTDQQLGTDLQVKLHCLIECLRTETRKKSNIFNKKSHSNNKAFKQSLLQSAYDLIKPVLDTITKALQQQKQKIQNEVSFMATGNNTQQMRNQQIKKRRLLEQTYVKEKEYKKAFEDFPFEFHSELIHFCVETKNHKFLDELIEGALLRIECRRIEVGYVNDVAIIASNTPQPNIPNGYQKIAVDLNEANLRSQLKKLRKSGKRNEKEEKKQAPVAQKVDPKKGGKQPQEPPPKNPQLPTQWELQQINHKYVFMIVKKSMSPQNAIYNIKIVLGDEEGGPIGYADTRRVIVPYIQQHMKVIPTEIKQYPGVQETTNLVPYIVLYHSQNNLENEEEKRTIITDIKPLIGKNPMIPPIWGYTKIPFDLRQVPPQFIKAPNHDYVYLTYKTDYAFNINSRHVEVLGKLNELEKTYPMDKVNSVEDEKRIQLQVIYDIEKLDGLLTAVERSVVGPLGQDYYKEKNDFLTQLCFYVWNKYMKGPILQFEYVIEQRLHGEVIDYDYHFYNEVISRSKAVFLKGLRVFNSILVNNHKSDILLMARINLQLAKSLQQAQQYSNASLVLKACLERIWLFRDNSLNKGLEGSSDKLLPFSITCSNYLIKQTITSMKDAYRKQRQQLRKRERMKKNKTMQLSIEEAQEEYDEYARLEPKDQIDEEIQKVGCEHSQLISIISAIQFDLTNLYFRVSLKNADLIKKKTVENANLATNGISNDLLNGLSSTLVQKLNLLTNPTNLNLNKSVKDLQSTLVKAGQLPSPKPTLHQAQLRLLSNYQKNPYMMSVLLMNFGAMNSGNEQKTYFMKESLSQILKAQQMEKEMSEDAINNSIFIFASLWDQQLHDKPTSLKISPFKQLYDGTWPSYADTPPTPILISRNAHSVTFKMPPYQNKRKIKGMSIYGKISANGVNVSLNCNELEGTEVKRPLGKITRVSNLEPHRMYCFAVAGWNENNEIEPIGKTTKDIGTFHPFPIGMMASYLSKISYQINEYEVAEQAAKLVLDEYCEKSGYLTQDEHINNLYLYRFNESKLSLVPLPQIRCIAEALYVLALCYRRKLQQLNSSNQSVPILMQQKQKQITNLIMLSSFLTPSLSSPLTSLPFLVPDSDIIMKAFGISLIPQERMNHRVRKLGVRVMRKVLKWGLQNNQINLARRIVYRWSERKWMMISKVVQVEEKKEQKKATKDSKQQQVKLIDKYCRFAIEKSPGLFDGFQESIFTINDEYSDYVGMFVEKAKEQISNISQYVDNPPQQLQAINNALTIKVEMVEYLKAPLASIGKLTSNSPYYLEYNCRLLRRALEISQETDYKAIITKSEEINFTQKTNELILSEEIYKLMMEAIEGDIEWNPCSKKQLEVLQDKTGKNLSKSINIFNNYEVKKTQLTKSIGKMYSLINKFIDYDYLNIWLSELFYLKGIAIVNAHNGTFTVGNPIRGRFHSIKQINLDDLLKNKEQVDILDKTKYSLSEQQKNKFVKILEYLSQSAFDAYCIENWIKMQNIIKIVVNLIANQMITPYYHKNNKAWIYLTFISLMSIFMLEGVKRKGFDTFRNRYNRKIQSTELINIANKLQLDTGQPQPLVEQFIAQYRQSYLSEATTKVYWFQNEKRIELQAITSLICYSVQCLRIEEKYNLVINVVRQFCNVTDNYYSLQLLPFMIESQSKLMEEVEHNIQKEKKKEEEALQEYHKEKNTKKKNQRQAQIANQKLPYQIQYQEKSKKIKDSLNLLEEQRKFILSQMTSSKKVIDEINRDTSKAVTKQREQRKYIGQFAEDEEHMTKQYGEQLRLIKNRKNVLKDIINRYNEIYDKLKNDRTSKDTLAQIQNRHQVGNLYYASGAIDKANEHWNDALSTIFKIVDPINNISSVMEKKPYLVNIIGLKQTLLSFVLLYKITRFGSYKQLHIQRKSTELATILAKSIFETDNQHPQNLIGFANYRLRSLPTQVLSDQSTFNLSELLSSLQNFAYMCIDQKMSLKSLPIISIIEYIGTDIVKNAQFSVKAKILKTMALADIGCIRQGILQLMKIANEKDTPIIWIELSDVVKREKGQNWYPDTQQYLNHKSWNQPENKQIIDQLKKLTLRKQFTKIYGIINPILFKFSVAKVLFKIYETEVCDNIDLNEIRLQNLNEAEALMRQCLRRLSFVEEFYHMVESYQANKLAFKQNQVNEELKKAVQNSKNKLIEYLRGNGIEQENIPTYLLEQYSSLKRSLILQSMCRVRLALSKIYQSKNLFSNSFFILKSCLSNLQRYSIGARNVENGTEPQIKSKVPQPNVNPPKKQQIKKGGKKQPEVKLEKPAESDPSKDKQLQFEAQSKKFRDTTNAYWHIKILYEIGKTIYKLNRFKLAIDIFEKLGAECLKYHEDYFLTFGKGYICRCMLRLGKFIPKDFQSIIKQAETQNFYDDEYISLTLDFGQVIQGKQKVTMIEKGKKCADDIWAINNKIYTIEGIGSQFYKRMYSGKGQLTAEQEEEVRKKKKQDAKGGKDDKKANKKQDGKKKKDETKLQFKAEPLRNYTWWNLLDDDKHSFITYTQQPHPNYHPINIYSTIPLLYIKCYLRLLNSQLSSNIPIDSSKQINTLKKLLHICESYPHSNYLYKVNIYCIVAILNKRIFQQNLFNLIKRNKKTNLVIPYQDNPLNGQLIKIPQYSTFLHQNDTFLKEAVVWFKKLVDSIKNSCLFLQNNLNLDQILWEFADCQCLLAQFSGRSTPKFYPLQPSATDLAAIKLNRINLLAESYFFLQMSCKSSKSKEDLIQNYTQIGNKALDPTSKIDEDVISDILEMDQIYKSQYPQYLSDYSKPKTIPNTLDIVTYMIKVYRQSEIMTFSVNHKQNLLLKCHRILFTYIPQYKDKCSITNIEPPLKKDVSQPPLQADSIGFKSKRFNQVERFLYILGPLTGANESQVIYGRVNFLPNTISHISEQLYTLRSKISISDKKSQAAKKRDYIWHQKDYSVILLKFSKAFQPDIESLEKIPQLTYENLTFMINMIGVSGIIGKNNQVNQLLRHLHLLKYKLS